MRLIRRFLQVVVISSLFISSASNKINNVTNLYQTLLDESRYSADIRPCLDCTRPLSIGIAFHLAALNKIDEIEGELNTVGYLKVVWMDERLAWNPVLTGVSSIMLPPKKVAIFLYSLLYNKSSFESVPSHFKAFKIHVHCIFLTLIFLSKRERFKQKSSAKDTTSIQFVNLD